MELRSNTRNNRGGGDRVSPLRNRREVNAPPVENQDGASGISSQERPTRTPSQSVLPRTSATTKTGAPRRRMNWTNEMNLDIIRCYYKATQLETKLRNYAQEFHALFTAIYPELSHLNEQRLISQKRTLLIDKRIPTEIIDRIKGEVARDLETTNTSQTTSSSNSQDITPPTTPPMRPLETPQRCHPNTLSTRPRTTPISVTPRTQSNIPQSTQTQNTPPESETTGENNEDTNNHTQEVRDEALNTLTTELVKWRGSNPNERPGIPRLNQNWRTHQYIRIINELIKDQITETSLEEIQTTVYCAAKTILKLNGQKTELNETPRDKTTPKWEQRLNNKVAKLRAEIGRITQYINGKRSKKILDNIKHILKHKEDLPTTLANLKQKLSVYAARLKRYKKSSDRKHQNNQFQHNEKKFYQNLNSSNTSSTEEFAIPEEQEILAFWKNIWSQSVNHNEDAPWIKLEEETHQNITRNSQNTVTLEELQQAIAKTHNWKAPGPDKVQNFWYKKLTNIHGPMTFAINRTLDQPDQFPVFLTEGITYIKPKNQDTTNPANYRPITCLSTLYKIISAIICNKIDEHTTEHNILSEEQKGCRKKSMGCKEQLTIDRVIMKQAETKQRNLATCYIDYRKAFDSIPHSWLLRVLNIYKVDPKIISFLQTLMKSWRTRISIKTKTKNISTEVVNIHRGIFQGDSLSALWFCIALNPLSNTLNKTDIGFKIKHQSTVNHTLNHLMYMDDIKLYAETKDQLNNLIRITEYFSKDIHMEFGIEKCKIQTVERGKWSQSDPFTTVDQQVISGMSSEETYKYLGYQQHTQLNTNQIKTILEKSFHQRLKLILRSQLNSKNMVKAINTYAIPILIYSFGVIRWNNTELEKLNRIIRVSLTHHRSHHPHACKERINIPRKLGGRGFIDLYDLYYRQVRIMREYFYSKRESVLHISIIKADQNFTPLNLSHEIIQLPETKEIEREKLNRWKSKELHSRHPHQVENIKLKKKVYQLN